MTKEENQERFLQAYKANGGFVIQACRTAGITRQTYWNWCADYKDGFNEKLDEVKEELEAHYLKKLDGFIDAGNLNALIFRLKSINGRKYDDKIRILSIMHNLRQEEQRKLKEEEKDKKWWF